MTGDRLRAARLSPTTPTQSSPVDADIAIGAKHLIVDRPLAQGENPRLNPVRTVEQRPAGALSGDDAYDLLLPPGTPAGTTVHVTSVRLLVETDSGGKVDALAFAGDCIKEWDAFLTLHGLT